MKETMTRIHYLSFATLLACVACSPPAPSTSHDPKGTTPVGSSDTPAVSSTPSEQARTIQAPLPEPKAPDRDLKAKYSDKAAFLASLEAAKPTQAIELDGKNVWKGFGPAIAYRTNGNGSISR